MDVFSLGTDKGNYKIIVECQDFMKEFFESDIKIATKFKVEYLEKDYYVFIAKDSAELYKFVYDLIYYSRCTKGIYLVTDEDMSYIGGFRQDLKLGKKVLKVVDLIDFDLSFRDYRIHSNSDYINSYLVNYCLYLLGVYRKKSKFTIFDPISNMGDVIIESSLFLPRKPLFLKQRHSFPIHKLFNEMSILPKNKGDKNKYLGYTNEDLAFKKLRENIVKSSQKIRISKYDLDWLDVKFKKNDVDYIITLFPLFRDDEDFESFVDSFFYQSEFCAKKICVISREKLSSKYAKKHGLDVVEEKKIKYGLIYYYIYVYS